MLKGHASEGRKEKGNREGMRAGESKKERGGWEGTTYFQTQNQYFAHFTVGVNYLGMLSQCGF